MTDPRARGLGELLDDFWRVDSLFPDPTEATHARAILDLIRTTPAPCSSEQYQPGHLTASALLVSPSAGEVLLIHHPTLRRWLQPGGHIDADDPSIAAAAAREVQEETGLAVRLEPGPIDFDVHPIPARADRPSHLHFDCRFVALVEGRPEPSGNEGILARWYTREAALVVVEDPDLRRLMDKAVTAGWLR